MLFNARDVVAHEKRHITSSVKLRSVVFWKKGLRQRQLLNVTETTRKDKS